MAKIMIDPGHAPGGANKGPTGYYEYAGMWKLSNYLKTALQRCGHTALLTRAENENPLLTKRGEAAKGCDVFISEHSNASGSGTVRGCEAFYSVRIPEDKAFAEALSKAASAVMGNPDRGAKIKRSTVDEAYDYFTVIGYAVWSGCPHVFLCETGFHDNPEDEAILKSDTKLQAIAEAQARVICEKLGSWYVAPPVVVQPPKPAAFQVGEKVKLKNGVTKYATGAVIASFIRTATLYVRRISGDRVLVSTLPTGAVTGWVMLTDLVKAGSTPVVPSNPEKPVTPTALKVGDKVKIKAGITTYADGTSMAPFIRTATLYVRQIGSGKVLVSTQPSGAVTGWVKTENLTKS